MTTSAETGIIATIIKSRIVEISKGYTFNLSAWLYSRFKINTSCTNVCEKSIPNPESTGHHAVTAYMSSSQSENLIFPPS